MFFHIEIMGNGAKNSDVFVRNLKLEKIEDSAAEKDRIHAAFVPEKELYTSKNGKAGRCQCGIFLILQIPAPLKAQYLR